MVESVQVKAIWTVAETGARSDEEMVASCGEDLGAGDIEYRCISGGKVTEVAQTEAGGAR